MARPQRQAQFFVRPDGVVIPKAKSLKHTERREIFKRDNGTCQICARPVQMLRPYGYPVYYEKHPAAVDHIFPRSRGGQNNPENLQLLCEPCNASKSDREWPASAR